MFVWCHATGLGDDLLKGPEFYFSSSRSVIGVLTKDGQMHILTLPPFFIGQVVLIHGCNPKRGLVRAVFSDRVLVSTRWGELWFKEDGQGEYRCNDLFRV